MELIPFADIDEKEKDKAEGEVSGAAGGTAQKKDVGSRGSWQQVRIGNQPKSVTI